MSDGARQSRRALLGAGIIVLLVAIAGGIFLLDDLRAALRPTYRIHVVMAEAPGVVAGAPVWVGGREVGVVETIGFRPSEPGAGSTLALTLELPTSVRAQVRRDSDVRVTSERMIDDPVIDLVPGSARSPALGDGDTLVARPRPTAAQVAARAKALQASMDSLRAAATVLAPLVERRRDGFQRVALHLGAAHREYTALMADVERSPSLSLLNGEELGRVIGRLEGVLTEVGDALARQQDQVRASGLREELARVQERARAASRALAALQETMRDGTLDRMGRDSALVHALGRARLELDSLLADVRRNPFRYAF
jgi:ABC-type transporter Mla subunit MlaD